MALVRWQPRDLFNVQDEIHRLFDEVWGTRKNGHRWSSTWSPAMDVTETEQALVVQVELPGLKREDIQVNVNHNVLSIRGERTHEHGEEKENGKRFHHTERFYGSFHRSFRLPAHVDSEKISAVYKDGVLTLTLPRSEKARPKEIQVN